MIKTIKRLRLNGESIRQLQAAEIGVAHGGVENTGPTGCVSCHPSDTIPQHCVPASGYHTCLIYDCLYTF